jgi:hypothetical protein
MSRVFLMKWYHFSVEYFEDLRNVNHCEFLIMRKREDSGKYILENNLRTWSELKRERAAAAAAKYTNASPTTTSAPFISEKDKEKEKKLAGAAAEVKDGTTSPVPVRKKWGGCPNGCNHAQNHYHRKEKDNSMHAMPSLSSTNLTSNPTTTKNPSPTIVQPEPQSLASRRPAARRWQSSSEEDEDDPRMRIGPPKVDVQRSLDEIVSSPDGTPSFISVEDRLRSHMKSPISNDLLLVKHAGRDFGGSESGNPSQAESDTEFSAEEQRMKRRGLKGKKSGLGSGSVGSNAKGIGNTARPAANTREKSGMGRSAMADALGDQVDVGSDAGSEAEIEDLVEVEDMKDLEKEEKEDKSIRGSVY